MSNLSDLRHIAGLAALVACATPSAAWAQTLPTADTTPACQKIMDSCMARADKAARASNLDGVQRPHLTAEICSDLFAQANATGVWPEKIPYGFAATCRP
jgi:mannose/fructose/N-acetylgalactosamine-specific phosphotransferase system component IIC